MSLRWLALPAAAVLMCAGAWSAADAQTNGRSTHTIDVSVDRGTGIKVRGPATITLQNINVLRYEVAIGTTVTFTAGPDLAGLPFVPPIPAAGSEKETVASVVDTGASNELKRLHGQLTGVETSAAILRSRVATVTRAVANAGMRLIAVLQSSDAVLQLSGGAEQLIQRLTELKLKDGIDPQWPGADVEEVLLTLTRIEGDFSGLPQPSADPDLTLYDSIKTRLSRVRTALEALRDPGDLATRFRDGQSDLRKWDQLVQAIVKGGAASFTRDVRGECGFQFGGNKETKFELLTRDRLTASASEVRRELLAIVCSSPLSISGGFGFSFVDDQTAAIVSSKPDSGTTAVNKFGFSSRSTLRPLPVLLLNTRVWEYDDVWSLHATGGAVVDISTGETGTDVEFVVGPSVAFSRTFFITTGWHLARVSALAGGFNEGDLVPEGVSEPPLEKSWSKGFALLATWKLR